MTIWQLYCLFIYAALVGVLLGGLAAMLAPRRPAKLNVFGIDDLLWGIGLMLASALLQALLTPKAGKPKAASLEDFDFPQFEEGTPQPIYFGDNWCPDFFVAWYGNLRNSPIKSSGGKK